MGPGRRVAGRDGLPARSPYDPQAWQRLAGAQAADGSVPEIGAAPASGDRAEAFTACYHSTLVTAFAATLARIASDEAEAGPPAGDTAMAGGRTSCESETAP